MFFTPAKKLFFIFILGFISLYISLPNVMPINFKLGNLSVNKEFNKPQIDFEIKDFEFKKNFDLRLGLDLAGGSHLVFEADTSKLPKEKKGQVLDGLKNIIERRVNLFGVSEPTVQTSEFEGRDRVIVELPGIQNTKDAVNLIGQTAQLSFAEVVQASDSATLAPTDLTGADLKEANVVFGQTSGKPSVSIQFTDEGSKKFEKLTEKNVGKPLAIIIDEAVISAPVVQEKISGGAAQISGDFSLDAAKNLSIQLNAGALPVNINLIEERTVGATLGNDSINQSIKAGVVGLVMVMVFMTLTYGGLGVTACVSLIIFGLITLALYKIIPVTLTLPGIAGFLLSVGMAVDSNILIFERFKEERTQRSIPNALEVSFGRAWDSIRDANIATLVTAFILANPFDWTFLHTSGPVRGFAITLTLGIIVSLFTGIVVSRNLLRFFVKEK